jgi:hypothetical protein
MSLKWINRLLGRAAPPAPKPAKAEKPTKAVIGKSAPKPPVLEPDWRAMLATDPQLWQDARERAKTGPRILIATSTGGHGAVTPLESLLAVALTLRGADVHFLLCDHFLPGCLQSTINLFDPPSQFLQDGVMEEKLCASCYSSGRVIYEGTGLPIHRFSDLVTVKEKLRAAETARSVALADIPLHIFEGIPVGDHAKAGTMRFVGRGSLGDDPYDEAVLRRYLEAAILTAMATRTLLTRHEFAAACFHHGIYVPQGVIGEVARQRGVRVVNWAVAYRKQCFVFSHDNSYHLKMIDEPVKQWEDMKWSPRHNEVITDYLRSRWQSSNDWIKFFDEPEIDPTQITQELGLDPAKPCIAMLTNVTWDAQLFYASNAFPSILDWVFETIRYFSRRPDLQLIIRIHPAEVRGTMKARQQMMDEIKRVFPELPSNVFVVEPGSQLSTYAIAALSDCALIYGTKTGVELTAAGIPVIVAGEAWIRNKGITQDASSRQDYLEILDRLPLKKRLDPATVERARKYAFHFFFRRMIPLHHCVEQIEGFPLYRVKRAPLATLTPGHDQGLDVVCDAVLTGSPFIFPAEEHIP